MIELSIIIPVYNVEPYIRKCLDSILCQSYQNYELLLVDDGSHDNSLAICREYEGKDHRIKVLHQPNRGPSAARNLGIALAQGRYLAFVDSDDYIMPDMFAELIRLMEEKHCDLVISPMTVEYLYFKNKRFLPLMSSFEGEIRISPEDSHKIFSLFETSMINSPCARLYKTEIIKANHILMPDGIHYSEDLIFNVDYLRYCKSIYILNQSFYFYTKKKFGSLTTSYIHQLFHAYNTAHDKVIDYLTGNVGINKELEEKVYYILVRNTIISFINLFYDNCPMTRAEKMSYIQQILQDEEVMRKIGRAYSPGLLPTVYTLLLKTRHTGTIYYACKFYKYYKNSLQNISRRTA